MNDSGLLLVLGVYAFYLYDAGVLLYFDDLLVTPGKRGWQVGTGTELEMHGRFVWLPHPLLPAATAFRASWLVPAGTTDSGFALRRYVRRLRGVRLGCCVAAMLLLGAIPAALLAHPDPRWLLAALAATWATTLAMLAFLLVQRTRLGLARRWLATTAAEVLLCPPYAINLYRKLCLARGFRGDPVAFAARHMPPARCEALDHSIGARIDQFLAAASPDMGTARLHDERQRIAAALRASK